ncbi:methyl-accepting chemotaxis protein [Allohahella sp. A8]|uniref:methyl-accepting chemotaxis protein n=1 Tax=Allohahella sp. A8 TaxID=3141461 RepID=UPI003A7F8381
MAPSHFFNRVSVGLKLAGGFIAVVVLAIVIAVTAAFALKGYADRSLIVADASAVEARLLDARIEEKNFTIRGEQRYLDEALKMTEKALLRVASLRKVLVVPEDQQRLTVINDSVVAYQKLLPRYGASENESSATRETLVNELVEHGRIAVETAAELQNIQIKRMERDYGRAVNTITIAAVTAVALAILLGWLLTRNVTRPIQAAVDIAGKVAAGNLAITIQNDRGDEFGRLFSAFDTMVHNLRGLVGEIGTGANSLAASSEELSAVTTDTSAAVANQRDKTDQVATAMNQMVATVSDIARNAESAFVSANSATTTASQGDKAVRETLSYVTDLKKQVDEVMNQLRTLHADTKNIGSILEVIKSVAAQTNLLALNAAIEAARAGEHGRGFAVVADEVRSLALRTQTSAEEIENLINILVTSAEASNLKMEQSTSLAGQTLESAEATRATIKAVVSSVEEIRQYNSQIATAAEEQTLVAEDINKNLLEIREEGEQTASSTEQISSSSSELARLAEGLNGQLAKFKV